MADSNLPDFCSPDSDFPRPKLNLRDLPDEMLTAVLSFLPVEELLKCRCICKWAKDLADQDELWQRHVQTEFGDALAAPEISWRDYYQELLEVCH
eukprot:TRINITY_DN4674_c0_g1_i2.p1 TRINITY_DN4674_c0_g1~~TRINITY_DN4674_c0_g1_i2.p1  ORF type:complete len:104 (-),score=13.62 TRINITY_DN4674_c0_g1_i2:84-368(-)